MLDHRQAVASRNRLGHSNPACRVNSNYGSAGDSEFDFWSGKNLYHDQFRDEVQRKTADSEGFEGQSPSWWKARNSTEYEVSPLLPYNYEYSNLCPRTRSEAIAQGRRELMEMIHNMPECNYELSLKDIVDEEKTSQGVEEEMVFGMTSTKQDQINKQKKKIVESGEVSRRARMENKMFLIKIFFPRSLASKKRSTSKNCSRVSPRTSFERSENHHDKEQRVKRISEEGGKETSGKISCKSNTSRKVEVNSTPGCWPIFHTKKSKSWGHRGCIF